MIWLPVPVPPQLEEAVGYPGGDARWLSLAWTACGDTAVYDDGRSCGTGRPWGYLAFVGHPAVQSALAPFDLGSSEADGAHRLLLDRHARRLYAAGADEAHRLVRGQWPATGPAQLSPEELEALAGRLRRALAFAPRPTPAEVQESMRRHARLVAALVAWLDAHLTDPP